MKVIIAGSRDIVDYDLLEKTIKESKFSISEVVCGAASGVDSLGKQWASENDVNIKMFPADWKTIVGLPPEKVKIKTGLYGQYNCLAGFNRNQDMADYGDALIAITNGSPGTRDMIKRAEKNGLFVFTKYV